MNTLGIDDRRHKSAPPRDEILSMAIERIKNLRAHLHDIELLNLNRSTLRN